MIILGLLLLATPLPDLRRVSLARDPAGLVRGLDGPLRKAARRGAPANTVGLLWFGLGLVGFALPIAGCYTVGGLTRDTPDSTRLVYQSPAFVVFAAAVEAAGDHLEITGEDQRLGDIRFRRGHYMNGILVCHGHVMAVFVSSDGGTRTRVEIVERTVSRLQPVGCLAQTPAYVERLNAKLGVVRPRTTV